MAKKKKEKKVRAENMFRLGEKKGHCDYWEECEMEMRRTANHEN